MQLKTIVTKATTKYSHFIKRTFLLRMTVKMLKMTAKMTLIRIIKSMKQKAIKEGVFSWRTASIANSVMTITKKQTTNYVHEKSFLLRKNNCLSLGSRLEVLGFCNG
jgi:hypothetical protein